MGEIMKNKNEWVEKLHSSEIKILDEFDRICKKNGLKYFFTGGTLIGAVRHKGFIPWDDDIDVGMTRPDFDKFIKCCKNDLKDEFYLDYFKSNKNGFRLYAKLNLKNTLFIESSTKNIKNIDNGIWLDIFPFDNLNKVNSKSHILKHRMIVTIMKIVNLKLGFKSYLSEYRKNHKIIMFFVDVFAKICPKRLLLNLAHLIITSNKNNNSEYIANMTVELVRFKESHRRNEVFPVTKLEFEGKKYYCPKEYDKILTKVYGDYMKLPPVEKRVTHEPCLIKFEDGEIINFENNKD